MKYRKKPVVVEAYRAGHDEVPKWMRNAISEGLVHPHGYGLYLDVRTPEGVMTARAGDYIVKGVAGEIYPCKPDIFEATYEAVGGE